VVAEGVETLEQLREAESWGCDEIQGYFYSRPVAADQIPNVLMTLNRERSGQGIHQGPRN